MKKEWSDIKITLKYIGFYSKMFKYKMKSTEQIFKKKMVNINIKDLIKGNQI